MINKIDEMFMNLFTDMLVAKGNSREEAVEKIKRLKSFADNAVNGMNCPHCGKRIEGAISENSRH